MRAVIHAVHLNPVGTQLLQQAAIHTLDGGDVKQRPRNAGLIGDYHQSVAEPPDYAQGLNRSLLHLHLIGVRQEVLFDN